MAKTKMKAEAFEAALISLKGGQGRVKDAKTDRRLAANRTGPTGQGACIRENDKRLAVNRDGPTGQGRVKDPRRDGRLIENGGGTRGQGRVKNPARDKRLKVAS